MCVLKRSHKAQILEHDESLSEDSCFFSPACTRCPDRGCGLCEDPAVLLASRASLLVDGMAVPLFSPRTGPHAFGRSLCQHAVLGKPQGCVMLFLSCPIQPLPRVCRSRALLMHPTAVGTARVARTLFGHDFKHPQSAYGRPHGHTVKVIPLYKG